MSYQDKNNDVVFPTRHGEATGTSNERQMLDSVGDVNSFRTVKRVNPDGSQTLMRTKGGAPQFEKSTVTSSKSQVSTFIPDFISGVVEGGYTLDDITAGAFRSTTPSATKSGLQVGTLYTLKRLNVPLSDTLLPTMEVMTGPAGATQYASLAPYKYTGRMRALVQFLLGLGKPPPTSWYTTHFTPPQGCKSTHKPGSAVTVAYDYKFGNSHGIAYGSDGEPWLIWINDTNGVWAFSLPKIFGSDNSAFLTNLAATSPVDTEGMTVWSYFKCFPTGEVPRAADLAAWVKTGAAFQLKTTAQMDQYSSCSGIATQLGWAFNYAGNEARAVGKKRVSGYNEGHYFKLSINIGAKRAKPAVTNSITKLRNKYLVPEASPIVRQKIEYISDADAFNVLAGSMSLDDVVVDPITTASATFTTLSSGGLLSLGRDVKIWDDAAGYTLSLSTDVGNPGGYAGPFHVFYTPSDALQEVKFADASGTTSSGPYCQMYDPRGATGGGSNTTNSTASRPFAPGGYGVLTHINTGAYAWIKNWWFESDASSIVVNGVSTSATCFVPMGDRESVVFAKAYSHTGGTETHTYTYTLSFDGIWYIAADSDRQGSSGCWAPGNGAVVPNFDFGFGPGIYNIYPKYYTGGPWAHVCDVCFGASYPLTGDRPNSTTTLPASATFEAKVISNGVLKEIISDSGDPSTIAYKYTSWFRLSPDQDSNVPYNMRSTANCLGTSTFSQCYDDLNSGKYKVYGSLPMSVPENKDILLNYVGVI